MGSRNVSTVISRTWRLVSSAKHVRDNSDFWRELLHSSFLRKQPGEAWAAEIDFSGCSRFGVLVKEIWFSQPCYEESGIIHICDRETSLETSGDLPEMTHPGDGGA